MTSFLMFLALAAAAPDAGAPGTLVGCAFPADGATEAKHALLGLGIYLPEDRMEGPIPAALISDPNGFLRGSGFDGIELKPGSIAFKGARSLRLEQSGGDIYHARLDGVAELGSCQTGQFANRDAAFAFFDEVIRGESGPE